MNGMTVVYFLIGAFLVGGIPTGYLLVKKYKKQDIRLFGSGNIGSTNVRRVAGAVLSRATQVLDILKGFIPAVVVNRFLQSHELGFEGSLLLAATAIASILGHDFTPYLGFRGGKGVNTTVGAFLLLAPVPVLGGISVFYLLGLITPVVSIRSMALGFTIPILAGLLRMPSAIIAGACLACFLILIRHRENIRRLLGGSELAP